MDSSGPSEPVECVNIVEYPLLWLLKVTLLTLIVGGVHAAGS